MRSQVKAIFKTSGHGCATATLAIGGTKTFTLPNIKEDTCVGCNGGTQRKSEATRAVEPETHS
jgi:phage baseplate assembly protein gpV